MQCKGPGTVKTTLRKNKIGLKLLDDKATIIKTMYQSKDKQLDRRNQIKRPEINPYKCEQLMFHRMEGDAIACVSDKQCWKKIGYCVQTIDHGFKPKT